MKQRVKKRKVAKASTLTLHLLYSLYSTLLLRFIFYYNFYYASSTLHLLYSTLHLRFYATTSTLQLPHDACERALRPRARVRPLAGEPALPVAPRRRAPSPARHHAGVDPRQRAGQEQGGEPGLRRVPRLPLRLLAASRVRPVPHPPRRDAAGAAAAAGGGLQARRHPPAGHRRAEQLIYTFLLFYFVLSLLSLLCSTSVLLFSVLFFVFLLVN